MEGVVGVERNEESKVDLAGSTEHNAADPVVYQLVRVDGDGRLVPATDDEIMVVEDFLDDDKSTLECHSAEAVFNRLYVQHDIAVNKKKPNTQQEGTVLPLPPSSGHSSVSQPGSLEGSINPPPSLIENKSHISIVGSSWKPDFSKLKRELCLHNLTVKELQETFRATFGRETTVKDKQWLKRRIVMGLTDSCDFSAASILKTDGILVKKGKEQTSASKNGKRSEGPVVGIVSEQCVGTPICHDNQMEDHVSSRDVHDSFTECNSVHEDLNIEQRAAKRVRKPTKRYIEELSEVENRDSSGKSISPNKSSGEGKLHQEARVRSVPNVSSNRPLVTRQDSLGGSGVQIPYVSRIRRGRPRENLMALVNLQPDGIGMEGSRPVKDLGERSPHINGKKGNEVLQSRLSAGWVQMPVIANGEMDNEDLNRKVMELDNGMELQNMNSYADSSDDSAVHMSMPQGGMRRKHHRPWSLSEVVKLVEGVAKYGAGRWSEIKRVAFASSPYRTSVDLKDKWRNLLRASFAQLPAEKGTQNARKHSSIPIPAAILVRVRELADMQAQVPPIISSPIKFGAHNNSVSLGRSVHVARSGYL